MPFRLLSVTVIRHDAWGGASDAGLLPLPAVLPPSATGLAPLSGLPPLAVLPALGLTAVLGYFRYFFNL